MKATAKTKKFLHEIFASHHVRPVDFDFQRTCFTAIYADGKRRPAYEFCLFSGVPSTWKHSLEKYLDTFEYSPEV